MADKDIITKVAVMRPRAGGQGLRIEVPALVRQLLKPEPGDEVVFIKGNMHSAERAAAKGAYVILRLERRARTEVAEREPEAQPTADTQPACATAPDIEPLDVAVRRKREERGIRK